MSSGEKLLELMDWGSDSDSACGDDDEKFLNDSCWNYSSSEDDTSEKKGEKPTNKKGEEPTDKGGEKPTEEEKESDTKSISEFYDWKENEVLFGKSHAYQVLALIGRGAHGEVVRCLRFKTCGDTKVLVDPVAVKIAKSGTCQIAMAFQEVQVLSKLTSGRAAEFFIEIQESFVHAGHYCIALELLDVTVCDYLKETRQNKMPLAVVRRVVSDVLRGLAKLKEIGLVHADIKPENIMLDRTTFRTKLIDFGGAHNPQHQLFIKEPYVQSRHFRAPEIILWRETGYEFGIDMWSLGCLMGELLTYQRLYPGRCNYDMLKYMIDAQGFPSQSLIECSRKRDVYFTKQGTNGRWTLKSVQKFLFEVKRGEEQAHLVIYKRKKNFELNSIHTTNMPVDLVGEELEAELLDRNQYGDLLKKMLMLDQTDRITPAKALTHPFVTMAHLFEYRHLESVKKSFRLAGIDEEKKRSAQDDASVGATKKKLP